MSKNIINFTFFSTAEMLSCVYCTIKVVLMIVVLLNTHPSHNQFHKLLTCAIISDQQEYKKKS